MSQSTTPTTDAPETVASAPSPGAPAGRAEVIAHLVAALAIGSVAPFLVLWTSPTYAFGVAPSAFELVDIAPQLVVVVAFALALLSRVPGLGWLRSAGWLVAAAGLLGFAALYFQGNSLDGQTLTLALVVVIAVQIVGLLLAFVRAEGSSRWAVATGLAAGIAGGRDAVALLVRDVRDRLFPDGLHGDDVVFAALAVVIAVAGVVVLVSGRRTSPAPVASWPATWWSAVRWPLVAVALASALAVGLTRLWDVRLDAIQQSYLGGISEEQAQQVQTWDQLARLGIAVLVAIVLAFAAYRWGGAGVARWVLVAFGIGLLVAGIQGLHAYDITWLTALLGAAGAVAGAALVRFIDRAFPWDALGLALASAVFFLGAPAGAELVAVFGLGIAATSGALRLAPAPGQSVTEVGAGGATLAGALGLAAWVLTHQVVAPAAALYRDDLGGLDLAAYAVLLAALGAGGFFLVDRRRSTVTPATAATE